MEKVGLDYVVLLLAALLLRLFGGSRLFWFTAGSYWLEPSMEGSMVAVAAAIPVLLIVRHYARRWNEQHLPTAPTTNWGHDMECIEARTWSWWFLPWFLVGWLVLWVVFGISEMLWLGTYEAIILVVCRGLQGLAGAPVFALLALWLAAEGKLTWYGALIAALIAELCGGAILKHSMSNTWHEYFGVHSVSVVCMGAGLGILLRWVAYSIQNSEDRPSK